MERAPKREVVATTPRLGYKSRGFWRRTGGVFRGLGGRSAVGFYGHSLSSFAGSWLEWRHLFCGTPECSRQISISQPPCIWASVTLGFSRSTSVHSIFVPIIFRPVSLSPSLLHSLVQDPGGPAPFLRARAQQRDTGPAPSTASALLPTALSPGPPSI
jgi:hypothetical protein